MPKDPHIHGRGGRQWKGDPPQKNPENKCPKCGNRFDIRVDHKRKKVEAYCVCFGKLVLLYKGSSFEDVDYLDEIETELKKPFTININPKMPPKKRLTNSLSPPSNWAILEVRRLLSKDPTATSENLSARTLLGVKEIEKIRKSIGV
jgi:hypothetical protein